MADVDVRRYGWSDSVREVTALLHRSYRPLAQAGLHYNASHQSPWTTWRRLRGGEAWIARQGGRIVGTVVLHSPARTRGTAFFDRPGTASFHQFAVDPALQGGGVGSRLLELVEERARELGAEHIACDTAESARDLIAFYERRGYQIVDRHDFPSTNYLSVILAKRLAPGS